MKLRKYKNHFILISMILIVFIIIFPIFRLYTPVSCDEDHYRADCFCPKDTIKTEKIISGKIYYYCVGNEPSEFPENELLRFCSPEEFDKFVATFPNDFNVLNEYLKKRCDGYVFYDGCPTRYAGAIWENEEHRIVGLFECLSDCGDHGIVIWSGMWYEDTRESKLPRTRVHMVNLPDRCNE